MNVHIYVCKVLILYLKSSFDIKFAFLRGSFESSIRGSLPRVNDSVSVLLSSMRTIKILMVLPLELSSLDLRQNPPVKAYSHLEHSRYPVNEARALNE